MKEQKRNYFSSVESIAYYIHTLQESGIRCVDGDYWPLDVIRKAFNRGIRWVVEGTCKTFTGDSYTVWEFDYSIKE